MKRLISLLLALVLVIGLVPGVHAASGAVSSNINDHFYINAGRFYHPIYSNLAWENGQHVRAEAIGSNLVVETYDQDFNYLSGKTIPLELPVFGGVRMDSDYNFVVVGQDNLNEDDSVEVFRIIRYTKDWQKVDHASLFGANTYIPFDAGSLRFDRSGDILYIRTSHEMYDSGDGLHHQANVMISVRISDMTVTDELTRVLNRNYGYISHSFNQFVRVDGDTLLAVDHGDALPRSVVLIKYGKKAGEEQFYGRVSYVNALPIADSSYHYNDTGVSVGGFECSSTDYLIAGSAYDMSETVDLMYAHRNIFVTATPKDNFTDEGTVLHWLTNYAESDGVEVSPPHMLKISADRFFLTWTENDVLKYCFLDGKGQLDGEIFTGEGDLSDCVPILNGSRIVWYVTNNSAPVFHEIDMSGPQFDPNVLAYGKAGDNITWTLDTDYRLTLTGTGEMYDFTSSTEPWNGWTSQITSAVVGEGITSIGNYTFCSCDSLTSVTLPSTLTRAGINSFAYCDQLETVVFPEGMLELGQDIFFRCSALTTVEIPDSVTTIGSAAFFECENLKNIELPANLTAIEQELFDGCSALETIIIPEGVTSIANYAFSGCTSLTTLSIPKTVTSIGTSFYECSSLKKFTLDPANPAYRTDSQGALYTIGMDTLVSIPGGYPGDFTIPNTVKSVQEYAGSGCTSMTSLVIPNSVTSLGECAFRKSTALTQVSIPDSITALPASCFSYCSSLDNVVIPDSVTVMEDYAFFLCTSLTQVDMPARLEQFGDVFSSCSALTSIVVPEGVTELKNRTFSSCSALETVTLPSTLTAIGQHCFTDCTSLRQINLPEGLTTIGVGAFIRCEALADLTLPSTLTFLSRLSFYDSGLSTVTFTGHAPTFESDSVFEGVTATVYYPMGDESWTEEVRKQYRGVLTWIAKDMHTHDWTAATCTAPQTCTICGATQGEALGHQAVTDPGYAATCTEPGLSDGSHCSRCSITLQEQTTIPALGHDYRDVITAPTCTESGFTTHTCSRCADSYIDSHTKALGHSYGEWYPESAPGCETQGTERHDCTRCNHSETRTVEALGHDHQAVVTAPTCTEQGFTTHTCSRCGSSYVDSYTAALGHDWDEGVVITEPTEESHGLRRHTCRRCSATEDRVIPALGHAHSYTHTVTAPTCTEQGYTTHTCDCGDSYIDSYTAALGHSYTAVITAPTCEEDGYTTHTCSRCADTYTDTPTEALGHDWKGLNCQRCDALRENPFSDTDPTRFYFDPVLWAVDNGITKGTSATEFSPDATCTRGQVVTFLWRAAGSPEPRSTTHPFTDVSEKAFYYKAMLWAVENGITSGMGAATFAPDGICTRGQVVTFLWRAKGKPAAASTSHPFTDVSEGAFYYSAMLWAVEQGITSGMSATTFVPGNPCTRGQVVTFLYRAFA